MNGRAARSGISFALLLPLLLAATCGEESLEATGAIGAGAETLETSMGLVLFVGPTVTGSDQGPLK